MSTPRATDGGPTRRKMFRLVREAGFYIEDNLCLLGAGGLLLNGKPAPTHFLEMNGWDVELVADALARNQPKGG